LGPWPATPCRRRALAWWRVSNWKAPGGRSSARTDPFSLGIAGSGTLWPPGALPRRSRKPGPGVGVPSGSREGGSAGNVAGDTDKRQNRQTVEVASDAPARSPTLAPRAATAEGTLSCLSERPSVPRAAERSTCDSAELARAWRRSCLASAERPSSAREAPVCVHLPGRLAALPLTL